MVATVYPKPVFRGRWALLLATLLTISAWPDCASAQSTIPPNLTSLRPIKGVSYDPKPSNDPINGTGVTFDSDFFNTDFQALWGSDGQPGSRNDLDTFQAAGLNLLHIYNWNAQRVNHTAFLDAAQARGIKVMIPISNFAAQGLAGQTGCCDGYGFVLSNIITPIFNQIYVNNGTTPHPAAAMWSIFNEYDINRIDPTSIAFVIQAIIQLENQRNVPAANRLPFNAPVSNAIFNQAGRGGFPAGLATAFNNAEAAYLASNPGKTDATIPPAVLALLVIAQTLQNTSQSGKTSYQLPGKDAAPVTVAAVPEDLWKNRFIASLNPFTDGLTLRTYLTDPGQFQSAWPGTTAWNTLPPLFFTEMGINVGGANPSTRAGQATWVLRQINCTHPLAANSSTPQGYFLGSSFFQHSFVRTNGQWNAFDYGTPTTTHQTTSSGPTPNQSYLVDPLVQLPVWTSVQQGYANASATCQ